MKIAIVHDYLREYGGAERVVEALHEIWPEAPLYTSFVDWKALGSQAYRFRDWDIRTSPIADNWFIRKFHSPLRFLAPAIWRSLDLSGYDVVLTSSGWFMCRGIKAGHGLGRLSGYASFAHPSGPNSIAPSAVSVKGSDGVQNRAPRRALLNANQGPLHICYIHHPPRNLYGYATGSTLQKYWPVRIYATIINFFLRHYDFETAQKVDYFIANSQETARRVEKFYRRESTVIYPPVEVIRDTKHVTRKNVSHVTHHMSQGYYLSVGRLTYSKRVDLAIGTANRLKLPLKIVGTGSEESYLRSSAGPTVDFLGSVSDDELAALYRGAKALIFCALDEDFGMVPLEAEAAGVPVIALSQGGILETVINGKTGVLFGEPTIEALTDAIYRFINLPINQSDCVKQAQRFSKIHFRQSMTKFVNAVLPK